ncbi:hypothetical protein [Tomitella gaofuii]|uniref:hypothetical protein n=1 Tax=Tomitella gaofuii TaxID=2760083 RepID=UPI0015FA51C8|nr:hypothetical protein [Tomitella gaofuii]
MSVAPYPYPAAALRQFLRGQPEVLELVPEESITTGALPELITGPFLLIAVVGNVGEDPLLRRPMVQVTPWVPKSEVLQAADPAMRISPDELAWNIGTIVGQLVGRARNISWRGAAWSARWVDGPVMLFDDKRSVDNRLVYAPVRFECKQRAPR